MTADTPAACSLGPSALTQRLAAIAEVGSDSLVSRDIEDGRHLLRFRANARTRQRLESIVAAEAECCSSLNLSLSEDAGEFVLSIAAPRDAQTLAAGLAGAFAPSDSGSGNEWVSERSGVLIGAGGLALAVCCIATPVIFGVAVGAALGTALDIGAAVLVAVGVALVLHRRRSAKCKRC